ncbi:unnamed protein product [Urochloa humidicola]
MNSGDGARSRFTPSAAHRPTCSRQSGRRRTPTAVGAPASPPLLTLQLIRWRRGAHPARVGAGTSVGTRVCASRLVVLAFGADAVAATAGQCPGDGGPWSPNLGASCRVAGGREQGGCGGGWPGGTAAMRREALSAPVLARVVEGMAGRWRECSIGVLATIYPVRKNHPSKLE